MQSTKENIRLARVEEASLLQELEMLAGERFAEIGMVQVSEAPPITGEQLIPQIQEECVWVYEINNEPVGFVVLSMIEDCVHIEEISVLQKVARQGIATQLLQHCESWAKQRNCRALTLTTFRDVPWNMPFYEKRGFVEVSPETLPNDIQEKQQEEARRGLTLELRACMEKEFLVKKRSMEELEAGLDNIRQSPEDEGILRYLVRRPARNEREILEVAQLDLEVGLVGDNWKTRGSSRTTDGFGHPDMQLNIMNFRAISLLAVDPERWALAGDQLYLDLDLSEDNLPPGTQLSLGSAIIEITAMPHTGCKKFTERFGVDAVKFVNSKIGKQLHLRGLNAKVIQPGTIRVGDVAKKVQ